MTFRQLSGNAARGAALLPVAASALAGRAHGRSWGAVLGYAVLSVLLGATALIPLGMIVAFVFRGVFYGLVDHGPYDHSWGGPGRAGAWAVHFLVSAPAAAVSFLVLAGLAVLHRRLAETLLAGRRPAAWVITLAAVIPLPAAAFFVAWLHQI